MAKLPQAAPENPQGRTVRKNRSQKKETEVGGVFVSTQLAPGRHGGREKELKVRVEGGRG